MNTNTNSEITIFIDGACQNNPGPGGWGVVIHYNESIGESTEKRIEELFGGEHETTNNRMELMAAIRALEILPEHCAAKIYTDSKYVSQGIVDWLPKWKKRSWKTADNAPVKNKDLWQRLEAAVQKRDIEWQWVKAHSGNIGNERADELAKQGITSTRTQETSQVFENLYEDLI